MTVYAASLISRCYLPVVNLWRALHFQDLGIMLYINQISLTTHLTSITKSYPRTLPSPGPFELLITAMQPRPKYLFKFNLAFSPVTQVASCSLGQNLEHEREVPPESFVCQHTTILPSMLSPALTLFHTLSYYNKIVHPSFSLSFILRLQFCHRSSTHWITFVISTVAVFLGHLQSASLLSIAMVLAMPPLLQAISLFGTCPTTNKVRSHA